MEIEKKEQMVIDYLLGECDENQKIEAEDWINNDSETKKLFNQFRDIIISSDMTLSSKFDDLDENRLKQLSHKITGNNKKHFKIYKYLSAASIIIAVVLGILFAVNKIKPSNEIVYTEYTVPIGGKSEIVLNDGTKVFMNSCSKLKYNNFFGIKNRDVLLEGEGYFEVAKNKELPFRVNTSDIYVQALGTKFNIKAYADDNIIETVLIEGKVKVEKKRHSGISGFDKSIILTPNKSVLITKLNSGSKYSVKVNQIEDAGIYTSWKDDTWIIKSQSLEDLAKQLERRYNISIRFIDKDLMNVKFTGKLRNEPIEQVFKAIELTAQVNIEIKGNVAEIKHN